MSSGNLISSTRTTGVIDMDSGVPRVHNLYLCDSLLVFETKLQKDMHKRVSKPVYGYTICTKK